MRIKALLSAIQTRIQSSLPELKKCELHGGRFDLAELKRLAAGTPAIYIACLGSKPLQPVNTGEQDLTLSLGAFIVTKDRAGLPRYASAINLAEAVALLVTGNRFAVPGVFSGTHASVQNQYNGNNIDKNGVAMWTVTWSQTIRLGEDEFATTGVYDAKMYLGLDP